MWYFGIDFNTDLIKTQSKDEFLNHPHHANHWSQLGKMVTDKVRRERLTELWNLVNPSKKEVKRADDKQLSTVIPKAGPAVSDRIQPDSDGS